MSGDPFDPVGDPDQAGRPGCGFLAFACALGAIGTFVSFVVYAIARSSYIHEGGDPSNFSHGPLVAIVLFGMLFLVALIHGLKSLDRD